MKTGNWKVGLIVYLALVALLGSLAWLVGFWRGTTATPDAIRLTVNRDLKCAEVHCDLGRVVWEFDAVHYIQPLEGSE